MNSTQWKIALGTALLGLCSLAAHAQAGPPDGPPDGPPPGNAERTPGPDREFRMLTRLLTLTTDQQKGVKTLLEQQAQQMKALRNKTPADPSTGQAPETPQAQMAQVDQIRDETNTKIAALLDDTQKPTFAEWVQKRKAAMEHRRSQDGNPPPPPPDGPGGGPGGDSVSSQ
jgi:protein CpxP